jgi:hypothetical protein
MGALAPTLLVGLDGHLQPKRTARTAQLDALVNEADKVLNPIQDGLNLHLRGWLWVRFLHTRFW